jgi:hypothetical protein
MTTCMRCNTSNAPTSQFCMTCGVPLQAGPNPPFVARSAGQWLAVMTGRAVIAIIGLWLIRMFLVRFSFIQALYLPEVPLSVADMVSMLIFLVISVLLIKYAIDLLRVWPMVYPRIRELGMGLAGLVLLLFLTEFYLAIQPLFSIVLYDLPDALLVVQVILAFAAVVILGWAFIIIYQSLPAWLATLRLPAGPALPPVAVPEEASATPARKK